MRSSQPETKSCSATRSATEAPTAHRSITRHLHVRRWIMQDHALEWIEFALPRCLVERPHGGGVARFLTHADARPTEIEVLGEILVAESRRHQAHDVHAGHAAVTLE